MITIQRVRVRWSASGRGAAEANARRGLSVPVRLPSELPDAGVVLHDVIADEATGYTRTERLRGGGTEVSHQVGLWIDRDGDVLTVDRLPGFTVFPYPSGSDRLFRLRPRQLGQYRANFRSAGSCCGLTWHYEDWLIRVGHTMVRPEEFDRRRPSRDVDHRRHLYGGRRRREP
ncbi:hypothetical protein Ait01nite_079760 [Actinoplanes italicus]|uniref:Uncharacterized protein n=1 Tax=Actinoplanes italicus TaxID=113567 RepID=A0A2T0JR92_9ACTN|nr:hypothetical protein [Actinoplanes italicus]PRX10148.1 hypothetical protein CLV67_13432 [Actinoplanes italicus]GIE34931.1 hypothetical protein Ait01nite_079760 [Actinoplanes italicus]